MIIINHSLNSLLFHENEPWVKKEASEEFDVTIGSNDGAEMSELVGSLMLSKSVHKFQDNSVGLYRDDGLGAISDFSGPETE